MHKRYQLLPHLLKTPQPPDSKPDTRIAKHTKLNNTNKKTEADIHRTEPGTAADHQAELVNHKDTSETGKDRRE